MKWLRTQSLEYLRTGLVTRKTQGLEGLNFQPFSLRIWTHLPGSCKERGDWRLSSVKTLEKGIFSNLPGWWTFLSRCTPGGSLEAVWSTPPPCSFALCISSICLFPSCSLYNKLINVRVFLSSVSHPSKLFFCCYFFKFIFNWRLTNYWIWGGVCGNPDL